ncbi:hypothetical protein OROHE_004951 [Orobanche hederae]
MYRSVWVFGYPVGPVLFSAAQTLFSLAETQQLNQWQARSKPEIASSSTVNNTGLSSRTENWQKPVIGELKCNVDATIFAEDNKFGVGACVRDENGVFRSAKTMWFYGSPSPLEAEAMGLLQSLRFIIEKNFTSVVIELDCQAVVNGITHNLYLNNDVGVILSLCKNILNQFPSYRISYIRRQANLVAHSLARASKFYARSHYYDFSPSCITTIIDNEMI